MAGEYQAAGLALAFFSSFKHFSYLGKLHPEPEMGAVVVSNDLLLESGSYLLLETGFKLILEP